MNEHEMKRDKELREAYEMIDRVTNSTLVGKSDIGKAFQPMHGYLLNQLVCGLLWAINNSRMYDGEIDTRVRALAREMWGR